MQALDLSICYHGNLGFREHRCAFSTHNKIKKIKNQPPARNSAQLSVSRRLLFGILKNETKKKQGSKSSMRLWNATAFTRKVFDLDDFNGIVWKKFNRFQFKYYKHGHLESAHPLQNLPELTVHFQTNAATAANTFITIKNTTLMRPVKSQA